MIAAKERKDRKEKTNSRKKATPASLREALRAGHKKHKKRK
jgi:hypothetical protein